MLAESQRLGFLGPAPIGEHIRHAAAFAVGFREIPAGRALDLGCGGGLPGLVLAAASSEWRWTFLDAMAKRTAFLQEAVDALGLGERVEVVTARAEDVGRDADRRGTYDVVTARGFAAPAITAECAAPLLRIGGVLLVSDPPRTDGSRWDTARLAELGLSPMTVVVDEPAIVGSVQQTACLPAYPRRVGVPGKRPLWRST